MRNSLRIAPVAFGLLVCIGVFGRTCVVEASPTTIAGIDAYAKPFVAKAKAHVPTAIFANFAGDGTRYIRYASEKAFVRELHAFLNGTAPGGGSFVARTYRIAGSPGLYVTFDPGVQNSLTERERVLFDDMGRAVWLHEEVESYNGYYRTVRDAYFAAGKAIADKTTRYDYAPSDTKLVHPLNSSKAKLDEMTIPAYETRATLPF